MTPEFRVIVLDNGCYQVQYNEGTEAWIDYGEPVCGDEPPPPDEKPTE